MYGYVLEGAWYDVGTPKTYLDTMLKVLRSASNILYFGEPLSFRRSLSTSRKFFYHGEPPIELPDAGKAWIQGQSPESIRRKDEILDKIRGGTIKLEGHVLIGRHCQIGEGTIIRDSCIDNFCIIGNEVTIERSAVLDRVLMGDGTTIQDSIIGRHANIKSSKSDPTWIMGFTVIGDDATIGKGSVMTSSKIFPHKVIPDGRNIANQTIE